MVVCYWLIFYCGCRRLRDDCICGFFGDDLFWRHVADKSIWGFSEVWRCLRNDCIWGFSGMVFSGEFLRMFIFLLAARGKFHDKSLDGRCLYGHAGFDCPSVHFGFNRRSGNVGLNNLSVHGGLTDCPSGHLNWNNWLSLWTYLHDWLSL